MRLDTVPELPTRFVIVERPCNMRAVAEGIENMGREEAAYWLGMAMHRKNPRRMLTALRVLLTMPKAGRGHDDSH